ncbi:hypothetical protein H4S07_005299, partial [Coemansia furcata]
LVAVALAAPVAPASPFAPLEPLAPVTPVAPTTPVAPIASAIPVTPVVPLSAPDAVIIEFAISASLNTIQCARDLELEVRNARDAVDLTDFAKAMDEAGWAMIGLRIAAMGEVKAARHAARRIMTRTNANVNLAEQVVADTIETFDRIEALSNYRRDPIASIDFFSNAAKLAQKRARSNVATWEAVKIQVMMRMTIA